MAQSEVAHNVKKFEYKKLRSKTFLPHNLTLSVQNSTIGVQLGWNLLMSPSITEPHTTGPRHFSNRCINLMGPLQNLICHLILSPLWFLHHFALFNLLVLYTLLSTPQRTHTHVYRHLNSNQTHTLPECPSISRAIYAAAFVNYLSLLLTAHSYFAISEAPDT